MDIDRRLLALLLVAGLVVVMVAVVGVAWAPSSEHEHGGDMPPVTMITHISVSQGFMQEKWIDWMRTEKYGTAETRIEPAMGEADMELRLFIKSPKNDSLKRIPFKVGWMSSVTLDILWETRDRGLHVMTAEIWEGDHMWDSEVEHVWV
ncbi:hypothetical protein ES706_02361 [subsurface metagenome]